MVSLTDGLRWSAGDPSPEVSGTKQELLSRRQTVLNAVNIGKRDLTLQIPSQAPDVEHAPISAQKDKFFMPQNHVPRNPDDLRQEQINSAQMAVDEAWKNYPRSQA